MKSITSTRLTQYIYFMTVFLTGAVVLILEVAAVRMLAPYFGSSLYVLSSVLTVILAALSFGYYLGGRIADRFPHPFVLYAIIATAGALMLALLLLSLYILPAVNSVFSITTGPLVLSLILFFVPAFLLGIDSPFVIKLLTTGLNQSENGALVGTTFFFSTIGSIVGSISAGFFFIPYLGLILTITAVSLVLIGWSIGGFIFFKIISADSVRLPQSLEKTSFTFIFACLVFSAGFFCYVIMTFNQPQNKITTLYQKDAYYSNIHIYDQIKNDTKYRFLKNDVNSSSAIVPGSSEPVFAYTQFADMFIDNNITVKNYLVLGGGSYTIPRFIHSNYPGILIDVSEVEPSLFTLSHQYFELPITDQIRNHDTDARVFLQSTSTHYDVIFSDVMNSGLYIPPHLSTVEFFESFKKRLASDGIAIINFVGSLDTSDTSLTGSMLKTITQVFPNHKLLALRGANNQNTQNMLFILRHPDKPIIIPDKEIADSLRGDVTPTATMIVDTSTLALEHQVVFTDDKSLVEPLILKQFAKLKLN